MYRPRAVPPRGKRVAPERPIHSFDGALLPHDRDLLPERRSPPRHGVRGDRHRRDRALAATAGPRRVLPLRQRRPRAEGGGARRGAGEDPGGLLRRDGEGLRGGLDLPRRRVRRVRADGVRPPPRDRALVLRPRARAGSGPARAAPLPRLLRGALLRRLRELPPREGPRGRPLPPPPRPRPADAEGGELVLPALRVRGGAEEVPRGESRLAPPGVEAQRDALDRRRGAAGRVELEAP